MEPIDSEPFRLGYRRWLDGLRGVAILLVLAYHFGFISGGWIGVDIFFVLSGFLITTVLAEEWRERGSFSLPRFYLRRALRLFPAFAVLLTMCAAAIPFLSGPTERTEALQKLAVAACYVANWPMLHNVNLTWIGHSWSLSVEEQFYLLWPAALLVMLRAGMSRRGIAAVVIAGIALSAIDRLILYQVLKANAPEHRLDLLRIFRMYMGLDTRADALLIGCLTGLFAVWGCLPRNFDLGMRAASSAAMASLIWISWTACLEHPQYYRGLFTVVALLAATVIAGLLSAKGRPWLARALELPPLVGTGRLSYGLYLYHMPVLHWLGAYGAGRTEPALCALAMGVTLALALVSRYAVELPFLRLKSRFENRSTKPPVEPILEARAKQAA